MVRPAHGAVAEAPSRAEQPHSEVAIEARLQNRGADAFVQALGALGATQVMTVTGGAIMETMDALASSEAVELVTFQTEQGAAWAAMGHAKIAGKAGVCVVTSGPAATNTVTPLADALRDNVPLVVVTGQVSSTVRNTDAFQETPMADIARPTVKGVWEVSRATDIAPACADAFAIAEGGRPGPVLLDLTRDAQVAKVEHTGSFVRPAGKMGAVAPSSALEAALDELVALLAHANRPAFILGNGVVLAGVQAQVEQLLELYPAPATHTLPGKAALPSTHPCNFGMVGMHGLYAANWLVHHADLIVSLGSRYDDRITSNPETFAPNAQKLVHFDISSEQITKTLASRKLAVVGDLRETLPLLLERLPAAPIALARWRSEVNNAQPLARAPRPTPLADINAAVLFDAVNKAVRSTVRHSGRSVIYTTEIGSHQMWSGQRLHMEQGWQFLSSSGQGAMGAGLPMAIGAQLADRQALVVCVAGDGSLRFSEAELETITQLGVPVKVIVLNDGGYSIVRMWNRRFYGGRETGVTKRGKDWGLCARSNGFPAADVFCVSERAELESTLRQAFQTNRPAFVEIQFPYEECLPFVPPGGSFDDIVT